jgi:hypothetical protein
LDVGSVVGVSEVYAAFILNLEVVRMSFCVNIGLHFERTRWGEGEIMLLAGQKGQWTGKVMKRKK